MKPFDLVYEFNREENTSYIYALDSMLAAHRGHCPSFLAHVMR